MFGLPHAKSWATIELRTTVKAVGADAQISFYQAETRPSPFVQHDSPRYAITHDRWPTIQNGMEIGNGRDIAAILCVCLYVDLKLAGQG